MKIGLVGLSQSGKTTAFTALTGSNTQVNDYPTKKPEINIGNVKVPDERIDKLAQILNPKKIVKSEITFVDEHESLRDKYKCFNILHIKEVEALVDVIRLFKDENILHPLGNIDPVRDLEQLDTELILADLEVVDNRLERIEKDLKRGKKLELEAEFNVLKKCKGSLEKEIPLRNLELDKNEQNLLSGFCFLSQKPLMLLINVDDNKIDESLPQAFKKIVDEKRLTFIEFCAKIEAEILELDNREQKQFLKELGIGELAHTKFIKAVYVLLDLISFFTVKNDILKSWAIKNGTKAQDAAGKIHTDIQRGFIKADVVSFEDFIKYRNFVECKKNNVLRLQGKDYIVKDADIINFKFHV